MVASAEEIQQLEAVHRALCALRQVVVEKRVILKPFFMDFDRVSAGVVTNEQFYRALTMININLGPKRTELLAQYYQSDRFPGCVNYRALLQHLENNQNSNEKNNAGSGTREHFELLSYTTPLASAHADVLRKVQTKAAVKRFLFDDQFQDFDKLKSGKVTVDEFTRTMTALGFPLPEQEMQLLIEPFRVPNMPNFVNYIAFQKAVAEDMMVPEKTATWRPFLPEEDNNSEHKLSDSQWSRVQQLLAQLGYISHTRRILLKPHFQDFDRNRNGCVTERLFRSIASTLNARLSPDDWDLLCNYYRKGALGISYTDFVKDITAAEQQHKEQNSFEIEKRNTSSVADLVSTQSMRAPLSPVSNTPRSAQVTVDAVLARLRQLLQQRNQIGIEDVFYDFDPLRKGHITNSIFRRCLSHYGFELSDQEMAAINECFSPFPGRTDYTGFSNALAVVPNQRFGESTTAPLIRPDPDAEEY